jgi:hypothetical protein
VGLKSAMSAHIYNKNNELHFASVIHNAGVGGSSPPEYTIISFKIIRLHGKLIVFLISHNAATS